MKKLIQEDTLLDTSMIPFSEYRKGSALYGQMIASIMDWLRNYKNSEKVHRISVDINKFLQETNIDLNLLKQFIENKKQTKLVEFDVDIIGNRVVFDGLNKSRDYNKESNEV